MSSAGKVFRNRMWGPILAIILVATAVTAFPKEDPLQTDEIIETVNAAQTTWKAGRNFHPSLKKSYLKNLVGTIKKHFDKNINAINEVDDIDYFDFDLPVNFDAREKWRFCTPLQEVRDQGSCGSCWAVSTSSAFADRLCIATNGSFNGHLSAQQLMTCCDSCGDCSGGRVGEAWHYFQTHGLVTGGDYGSKKGCQPYTIPECEHYISGPRETCTDNYDDFPTPKCQNKCYNSEYTENSFKNDLYTVDYVFGASLEYDTETNNFLMNIIQKEIYENGPVTAAFQVYEDFLAYKKGVYQHITGGEVYGHAVKVIGWGEEEGTPYWLVANSWNSDWGDNGFFKIRRGNNECGFEEMFHGGSPDISEYKM